MSTYFKLKQAVERLQDQGGVVTELQIAEDVQCDLIAELLSQADTRETPRAAQAELQGLQEPGKFNGFGLTLFEGVQVRPTPAGWGGRIIYHE
ncbi:MAG: hypothetical protein M3380_12630 [Chloroflexota bacterium]|nr:hypothetical protein [Chloroflexota bacterium]